MNRIALGLEYDGSLYYGWQRQTTLPSIQGMLENALTKVAAEPVTTIAAGRTDAGVHASGQVVHFDTNNVRDCRAWVCGTNTFLPTDLRVLWASVVPESFDARRSALGRRYRYVIYNHPIRPSLLRSYVGWCYKKLDIQNMIEATHYWLGEHDFSSFRAAACQSHSAIRLVTSIQLVRVNDQIVVDIAGNAFLHHMVRNMVGVLMKIGSGAASPNWAKEVLEARDRRAASETVSSSGLYLVEVNYPQHFKLPEVAAGPWFLKTSGGSLLT